MIAKAIKLRAFLDLNKNLSLKTVRNFCYNVLRRVDFFVEGAVMLELKAVAVLNDVHLAQAINYLEAYGGEMEVGLLINFGGVSLEVKRVMKPRRRR